MAVVEPARRRARGSSVELVCTACGARDSFPASSPAAPVLTACETAHRTAGWSYVVGFFAMLTGDHQPRCGTCTRAGRY